MGRWKMPALGLAALAGIQTVRMGLVFLAQLVGPDSLTWNRVYNAAFFLAASAALFGLWHVGYADTILCRMAWTGREGNLIAILCGKVLTGFLLGLCFGWPRRKFRNGFPGLLAHIVLNTMG